MICVAAPAMARISRGRVTQTAIVLACAGAVAALLYAEHGGRTRLTYVAKPAASAAFIAIALSCGATDSQYGRLILIGLAFCFAGDVLLMGKSARAFLAGMAAFALGHGAYVGAFAAIRIEAPVLLAGAAIVIAVSFALILRWLWPHLGAFRAPVALYCLVIGAMVAVSFAAASPAGSAPYWPAAAGAVMFAVSDIAVARDRFVRPVFFNRLWGLPLYYAAQLLLAASVSLGGADRLAP